MTNRYVDNRELNRREFYFRHEDSYIFYGWCDALVLKNQPKNSIWKPHIKFGEINGNFS